MKPPEPTSLEELLSTTRPSNKTMSGFEITFDPNYLKEYVEALIKSEQTKLLDRLEKQLPKKESDEEIEHKIFTANDWNDCLDQVLSALESERRKQ